MSVSLSLSLSLSLYVYNPKITGIKNNVKTYHSILGDQSYSKNPSTEKNQGQIDVLYIGQGEDNKIYFKIKVIIGKNSNGNIRILKCL